VHYFTGGDASAWRTNVPLFARVRYEGVYPGIDLVYYGNQRQLEYDFVVAPGADPRGIGLQFAGADDLQIEPSGDLVIRATDGSLTVRKPVVYQPVTAAADVRFGQASITRVDANYDVDRDGRVRFALGPYDRTRPLVIDPTIVSRLMRRTRDESPLAQLNEREQRILALVGEGRSDEAIAAHLAVTTDAYEAELRELFGKLGLSASQGDLRRVVDVLGYLRSTG
jgi:DNA-binding CsgD family transcriptional regulator